jgi:putative ABC transport system substrate-binding protein
MAYSVDPVANGFVQSLAHPGGNTTGLASSLEDTSSKQLELLMNTSPNLSRVGLLLNPGGQVGASELRSAEAYARKAGIAIDPVNASNPQEVDSALSALKNARVGGILVVSDALFMKKRQRIVNFALDQRLPTVFPQREYVEAGGLLSYGESLKDFFRRSASFVDKILKGAKPSDLPVEQPTRFFLVVNLKTAKAIGLTLPPTLLALADEVIE